MVTFPFHFVACLYFHLSHFSFCGGKGCAVMSVGKGWGSPFSSECPGAVVVYKGMSMGVSLGGLSNSVLEWRRPRCSLGS